MVSIKDDIEAIEATLPLITAMDRDRFYFACAPDRIKRVVDALKAEQVSNCMCVENNRRMNAAEARLSKACELLKGVSLLLDRQKPIQEAAMAEIGYLLAEVGHE